MEVPEYELPEAAIAQVPIEPRDASRLLVSLDPADPIA
ncbi:MAG: S-adenosylmethionine:tRNA ribosyltransferase-isomerase, partial [Acidimicrobiales bacterium]